MTARPTPSRGSRASSGAPTAPSPWRPSRCPGGSVAILTADAVDTEAEAKRTAAARTRLEGEIARAEGKLGNRGFVDKAPRAGRRGRAREARAPARRARGPRLSWSLERAEDHLLSLELFGMKFGLERMRRLLTALGSPQQAFRAIHVVGTNGKSSTVRMAAAILEAHGVRTGAYLSPHLATFAERIRIGDADLEPDRFGAAVERAASAAAKVDRTLTGGEHVTQFELLTAAAFSELAEQGVEVAVVEAGLGGRHDATNVLAAPVAVLTNVGLEHTRWLGPTLTDIAREKLAVVAPGSTLVVGPLEPEVEAEVAKVDARVLRADAGGRRAAPGLPAHQLRRRARRGGGAARRARRRRRAARRLGGDGARALRGRRRGAADDLRRRAQPERHRRARVGAARGRRPPAPDRGAVRARRQGRRRDAARARRPVLRRGLHRVAEPARALAGHARLAVEPAVGPAGARSRPSRTPRCAWRASSPGRMEPSWRPDRSTSWPTCCPPRAPAGGRRCERARARRAADGRPRRGRRRARDPGLLRPRLPVRPDCSCKTPGTLPRVLMLPSASSASTTTASTRPSTSSSSCSSSSGRR